MAGHPEALAAHPTHEPSATDALDYATIAEEALQHGDSHRWADALRFGFAWVRALGQRRGDEHLHVTIRSLVATVDQARVAFDAAQAPDDRGREAVVALRRTVAQVDDGVGATAGRWYL